MEARSPSVAPVSVLKRARALLFPGGFEQLLIRVLATRSTFIRDQLDCRGEAGAICVLELPEGFGCLWLLGLLSTTAELHSTSNSKVAEYLKAADFFQDADLEQKLTGILGNRLFKPQGATSSAAANCSRQAELPDQVLQGLSDDQAIAVLHKAPGTFEEQFIQLSSTLRDLAALTHLPGIGEACISARECPGASPELPALFVCVDTQQPQADLGFIHDTAPSSDSDGHVTCSAEVAGASMWPLAAEVNFGNACNGLFSLEQRGGSIACCLFSKSRTLQNHSIALPGSACVVFGSSSGDVHLKNVTFQGGSVVCMGGGCSVTFDDAVFEKCSLVVLSGAQVNLNRTQFHNMGASSAGISVYAHGAGTKVAVKGGTITGGTQGATVQAGACLEASDLTITSVEVVGVEVTGEGSSLHLSSCRLHEFSPRFLQNGVLVGVRVDHRGSAHLSNVSMTGMLYGFRVVRHASGTLVDCTVSDTEGDCVQFMGSATGRLDRCTLSGSKNGDGLQVATEGTCVNAARCHFLDNKRCGVVAIFGSTFTADACTSSGNRGSGFYIQEAGTVMQLTDCSSNTDHIGCVARAGGVLTASKVVIRGSAEIGCEVLKGASAVLRECTAASCGHAGVSARCDGSRVEMEGCNLYQNGGCGAVAGTKAVVIVRGCSSSGNGGEAYKAKTRGQMTVSSSSSDGDKGGCTVAEGGQVIMVSVTVDGVLQSGHLF